MGKGYALGRGNYRDLNDNALNRSNCRDLKDNAIDRGNYRGLNLTKQLLKS